MGGVIYSFDGFRLDVRERRLWRDDQPVLLRDKVFETLVLLVGLPPMLLLAGDREVLFDKCHVGRAMQRDWPLTLPRLDESRAAWSSIAEFVAEKSIGCLSTGT